MIDSLKIIRPFRNVDHDVSDILKFQYIHYRFGRIEKQYFQKFEKYIYDTLDTIFIKCSEDEQYYYGVYFVPKHQAHKVHAVYSSMHFEQILCRTATTVLPRKPSLSWINVIKISMQALPRTKRLRTAFLLTTKQISFLPKLRWTPVLHPLISAALQPAQKAETIRFIFYAAG